MSPVQVEPPPDDGVPQLLYKAKLWTMVTSDGDASTEPVSGEDDSDGDDDSDDDSNASTSS